MNWAEIMRAFGFDHLEPPKGLAILFSDGNVLTDLPLMYLGINDDGLHEWEACVPGRYDVALLEKARVHIDYLPPGTTVSLTVDLGYE